MQDWFQFLRTRTSPNGTVLNGFAHAVAVIMAAWADREGRKLLWDPKTKSVPDRPPAA